MKLIKKIILIIVLITALCPQMAAASQKAPDVKALGAVLIDGNSGRVLWEKNADTPLANASTTKIMTCILALESGKTEDTVTVSKNASVQPKTRMGLSEGERIGMEALLYALMLQSSNDAAVAIAEHVSGSVEAFCDMMDEKAAELGAADTDFETPNGLDKNNHHSTAYDMALITGYALNNDKFKDIISTEQITVDSDRRSYTIVNKNRLLREYDGAVGVKTGFTGKAGHCFVGAAERDGMLLISVVLGSGWGSAGKERKWTDTKNLLNYGFENYAYYDLCKKGEYIDSIPVKGSYNERVRAVIGEDITLPLTEYEREALYTELKLPESVDAPVKAGDELGMILFKNGSERVITECPLTAESGVDKKDIKTTAGMLIKHWINPKKSDILKK